MRGLCACVCRLLPRDSSEGAVRVSLTTRQVALASAGARLRSFALTSRTSAAERGGVTLWTRRHAKREAVRL